MHFCWFIGQFLQSLVSIKNSFFFNQKFKKYIKKISKKSKKSLKKIPKIMKNTENSEDQKKNRKHFVWNCDNCTVRQ